MRNLYIFGLSCALGFNVAAPAATVADAAENRDFQAVIRAIRAADLGQLQQLLVDPHLLEARDEAGSTPLMYAAVCMDAKGIEWLLNRGANPNAKNNDGASALLWAATDLQKLKLLLRHGANVNAASASGNTPLIVAALQYGSADRLRALLLQGAAVNASNDEGVNALIAAARTGDCEALRVLIRHGAEINNAAEPQVVTHVGGNALMNAAAYGHLDALKLLVKAGADVNAHSPRGSALAWAAFTDRKDCAAFLLKQKAQVNVSGVRAHSYRSDSGYTPLMYAAMSERDEPELVQALLRAGADVNAKSSKGENALSFAELRGHTRIVETLRRAGASNGDAPRQQPPSETFWSTDQLQTLRPEVIHQSVETSLKVLLKSSATFSEETSQRCFSCHQHSLPAVVLGQARESGFSYDSALGADMLAQMVGAAERRRNLCLEADLPVPSIGALLLLGLHVSDYQPDFLTDAYAQALARTQYRDGRWITPVARAPSDYSDITSTALSLRALQLYAPPAIRTEFGLRVDKAAAWLRVCRPQSTEERALQMLGLHWAGAGSAQLATQAKALTVGQRVDGGWAQLPTLEPDAYATGQVSKSLCERAIRFCCA